MMVYIVIVFNNLPSKNKINSTQQSADSLPSFQLQFEVIVLAVLLASSSEQVSTFSMPGEIAHHELIVMDVSK